MKFITTIITSNRCPDENYIMNTIKSLEKENILNETEVNVFDSGSEDVSYLDFLKNKNIIVHTHNIKLNLNENRIRAFETVEKHDGDYIIFLEDDIELCDEFLFKVKKFIKKYDVGFWDFCTPYDEIVHRFNDGFDYWDCPIEKFYGTQCIVIKKDIIPEIIIELKSGIKDMLAKGKPSSKGGDLHFKRWFIKHNKTHMKCCVPSLVQHKGKKSTIDRHFWEVESFKLNHTIPKIIHHTWKTKDIPYDVFKQEWVDSWRHTHPDWEYKLWTDEDNINLIKEHYPWFLETYEGYDQNIKRADAIRYFILYHYGGMYVDLDFECLKSIEPLIKNVKCGVCIEPKQNRKEDIDHFVCNAFMVSARYHRFWHEVHKEMIEDSKTGKYKSKDAVTETGPKLLTRVLKRYKSITIFDNEETFLWPDVNHIKTWGVDKKYLKFKGGHKISDKNYGIHYNTVMYYENEKVFKSRLKYRHNASEVSLITRCMNRGKQLKETIGSWVRLGFKEIIIVDWSSSEDIQKIVDDNQNGSIYRIYVPDKKYFNRCKAINIGARFSSSKNLALVNCDIVLHNNFLRFLNKPKLIVKNGKFETVNECFYISEMGIGNLTSIIPKDMFFEVNGLNENFKGWGYDSYDLFKRLKKLYTMNEVFYESTGHLDHDDLLRSENQKEKDLRQSHLDNEEIARSVNWNDCKMEEEKVIIFHPDGKAEETII